MPGKLEYLLFCSQREQESLVSTANFLWGSYQGAVWKSFDCQLCFLTWVNVCVRGRERAEYREIMGMCEVKGSSHRLLLQHWIYVLAECLKPQERAISFHELGLELVDEEQTKLMYFPHSFRVGVRMMKICCFWETEEMNEQYQWPFKNWYTEYWWVVGMKAFFPTSSFIFKHHFILILNGLQSYNVQIDKVVWKNRQNAV